jgi:hypothetical protein
MYDKWQGRGSIVTGISCKKPHSPPEHPAARGAWRSLLSAVLVMVALLVLSALPGTAVADPAQAGLPGHAPDSRYLESDEGHLDRQTAFLHLASQYAVAVVGGLVVGGLLLNWLAGGVTATMGGSLVGLAIAGSLYLRQASDSYVVQEGR